VQAFFSIDSLESGRVCARFVGTNPPPPEAAAGLPVIREAWLPPPFSSYVNANRIWELKVCFLCFFFFFEPDTRGLRKSWSDRFLPPFCERFLFRVLGVSRDTVFFVKRTLIFPRIKDRSDVHHAAQGFLFYFLSQARSVLWWGMAFSPPGEIPRRQGWVPLFSFRQGRRQSRILPWGGRFFHRSFPPAQGPCCREAGGGPLQYRPVSTTRPR